MQMFGQLSRRNLRHAFTHHQSNYMLIADGSDYEQGIGPQVGDPRAVHVT